MAFELAVDVSDGKTDADELARAVSDYPFIYAFVDGLYDHCRNVETVYRKKRGQIKLFSYQSTEPPANLSLHIRECMNIRLDKSSRLF